MPREEEFAEKLGMLIAEYADVPGGARGTYLFVALSALIAAAKGSPPTGQELVQCLLPLVEQQARLGMISDGI